MDKEVNINKKSVIKNLATYLIILLIPCIIGGFAYNVVSDALIEDTYKIENMTLENIIKEVDGDINNIYTILLSNYNNRDVMNFSNVYGYETSEEIYEAIHLRDSLTDNITNSIIDVLYFYKNSNLVISKGSIEDLEVFYNNSFSSNYESYNDFYDQLFTNSSNVESTTEQSIIHGGKEYSVLTFKKSVGSGNNSKAVIVALLNTGDIKKKLNQIKYEGGEYIVVDTNGKEVFSTYGEEREIDISDLNLSSKNGHCIKNIDGIKMIVTYNRSSLNSWVYISMQPYNEVLKKVNKIKFVIIQYIIIYFIIGVVLSVYWAKKNVLKFSGILKVVNDSISQLDANNEIDYTNTDIERIRESLEKFTRNNKLIEENSIQQKAIIKNLIFNKILHGNFNTNNEIENYSMSIENDDFMNADIFNVMVIQSKYLNDEKNKIELKELIKTLKENNFEIVDSEENNISIILFYNDKEDNKINLDIDNLAQQIIEFYKDRNKVVINIGIGSTYKEKLSIYKCYNEAITAIDSNVVNENLPDSIHRYTANSNSINNFYYPIELETRLVNCTKLGLKEEVSGIIEQIIDENFYNRVISPTVIKGLLFELYGTFIKVVNQVNNISSNEIDNEIQEVYEIIQKGTPSVAIIKISEIYSILCEEIINNKSYSNEILKENIIEYIKSEFINPNLTIADVADEFRISSGHAAKIIKEYTGETFFSYLENIRMENAQKLIDTTSLPIYVIAEKSGYQLSATFCRAYKRRYNISPNKTRQNK